MAKTSERKKIIARLDKLTSQIVRLRSKSCVLCGKTENLQCGHIFSRVNYSTRWDLENCWTQCAGCNLRHEYDSVPFYRWFTKKFGQEEFDKLYDKHHQISHYKLPYLRELEEQLNSLFNGLMTNPL